MPPSCTFPDCPMPFLAKGWCSGHYRQFRLWGVDAMRPLKRRGAFDPAERDWVGGAIPMHLRAVPATAGGMHHRIRETWGSAAQYLCIQCGGSAQDWAYDGTDPEELYLPAVAGRGYSKCSPWPEFYMPMCKKCHKGRDAADAAQELHEYRLWKSRNPGRELIGA